MKTTSWLSVAAIFGISLSLTVAEDQQPTPAAPPATPPAEQPAVTTPAAPAPQNAPAKESPKSHARKPAPTPPENAGPPVTVGAATAKQNNINVRGKPAIKSEVLGRLKKGEQVEVLEIVQQKAKPDEPDKWARVALPTNAAVWIHSDFIDAPTKTVKPKRLNMRSGPSEDYSVIGHLEHGAVIKDVEHKNDWVRIEPPQGIYGFVAAHLLAPATPVATPPPVEIAKTETPPPAAGKSEPPVETVVAPAPPATPPPPTDLAATTPSTTTPITVTTPTPPDETPAPAPAATPATPPAKQEQEQPPQEEIKRIVSREGIVKRSVSIQAPTWFVLESPATGKTVNYLYTPTSGTTLRDYFGQRVIVTGEEGLDERWPHTPVINVESIEVVP